MDLEDRERQRKRQFVKVLIAEIGMVLSVLAIVVLATLSAMGFFVSKNGTIEQSGLVQIHSIPTGASVDVDGNTLFPRTNLSRSMAAGEYEIKITRDGYDTWKKRVPIRSGTLLRLYYPRLFLLDRTAEAVQVLGSDLKFYSASSDQTNILYSEKDGVSWRLLDIRGDDVKTRKLDLTKVLATRDSVFDGAITIIEWSKDNNYVLIRAQTKQETEWLLINLTDVSQSLNLTKTFGMEFEHVEMAGGSARQLFVLEKKHLRRISTADQAVSKVLLDNIKTFSSSGMNLIYVAEDEENGVTQQLVGTYRDGEAGGTTIAKIDNDAKIRVHLSTYYDEEYLAYSVDRKLTIYFGAVPAYRKETDLVELSGLKILMQERELKTIPEQLQSNIEGEILVARNENQFMVVDFETNELTEYSAPVAQLNWLDETMMYGVYDGKIEVWDFDFLNRRVLVETEEKELASNKENVVTTKSRYPVMKQAVVISENNKWLYYLVEDNDQYKLVREKIRE